MSGLVINIILEPGEPGCRVAITSDHDQVMQQFGAPREALDAALLAREAIRLAEEQAEHLQQQRQPGGAPGDRIVERRPTGDSYLDEVGYTGPQLDGHFNEEGSEVIPGEAAAGVSVVPNQTPDGMMSSLRGFTDEPGEAFLVPEPQTGLTGAGARTPAPVKPDADPEYLFTAARHQAAAALRVWDEDPRTVVARLAQVEALLDGALSSYGKAVMLSPLCIDGQRAIPPGLPAMLRSIGSSLQERWDALTAAGDVKHIEAAWKRMCGIQRLLSVEVFRPAPQQETAPACAEASPPAGLPA